MNQTKIVMAGATGDLGFRISKALLDQGTPVRALLRPSVSVHKRKALEEMGVETRIVEFEKLESIAEACEGASCFISAVNGLRDVIVDHQKQLIDAAVMAKVPRFIPSDYAADFTKTIPGENRNFDLRREFMEYADSKPIQKFSILNGAFMDLLGAEMPIIQPPLKRVLFWGSEDQRLDFTTKDNVASFVAAASIDRDIPRFLRVTGDTVSAREIAKIMTAIEKKPYRTLRVGSVGFLSTMIKVTRFVAPQTEEIFPAWQGMQYMRDMMSGRAKLEPIETNCYPQIRRTSVLEYLSKLRS